MAVYYIDFENGNDANAGTSFATRWKTFTNGATAARIAPGDEIRVMASPDPTLVGNGTWTNGPRGSTINISSSTNATPIVITTASAHGLVTGDYVSISGHLTNTNANGVWRVGTTTSTTFQILQMNGNNTTGNGTGSGGNILKATSCIVKLASAATQNIALCGGLGQKPVWTASTNVTCAQNISFYKEGNSSAQIDISAAFTTGKAAYYTLPSTLDLSGYQQVTFWVRLQSGSGLSGGQAYLALCTDTTGDTVAHQCNIPAVGTTTVWAPVTVNLGTNLSATIRSVAFYIITDVGAQTFYLDNIVACKAASSDDSINLTSLISKSDGTGDEGWYAIQSINSDAVMLANDNTGLPNANAVGSFLRGYTGTTETVPTYKRETIKQTPSSLTTTAVNRINDSGTAGNLIAYSGGWNRTDMSTQTGETWYDGVNGLGYCYTGSAGTEVYNSFDKLNAVRFTQGWRFVASGNINNTLLSFRVTACNTGLVFASYSTLTGPIWANNNLGNGINVFSPGNGNVIGTVKLASNNNANGVSLGSGSFNTITSIDSASNNATSGVDISSACANFIGSVVANANNYAFNVANGVNNRVGSGSSASNITSSVFLNGNGSLYLNNFVMGDTVEVLVNTATFSGNVFSNRNDNTDNNSWVYGQSWTANQQTSIVDSPATTAWKISPTSSTTVVAATPAKLKLGTVVCAANSLVTVTARMRRDNTGLTMRLICPGGQISGVSSDVFSDMTAAADTWETVTITFTPTKAGAVDIYAYAFGGTTYSGYVCNLTASQA